MDAGTALFEGFFRISSRIKGDATQRNLVGNRMNTTTNLFIVSYVLS